MVHLDLLCLIVHLVRALCGRGLGGLGGSVVLVVGGVHPDCGAFWGLLRGTDISAGEQIREARAVWVLVSAHSLVAAGRVLGYSRVLSARELI